MERINGWALLEQLGAQMENSMKAITKGKPLTFKRIGSMFCLYFTNGPVLNLADAKKSDSAAFARYFHASLNEGIYFAPSQFEAGFLSTAHDTQELDHTAERINKILKMI